MPGASKIIDWQLCTGCADTNMIYSLNCRGRLVSLEQPIVMGIINCTPDSFYAGSRLINTDEIVAKAMAMFQAGATILDIGGQSTRPGSNIVPAFIETERVLPTIKAIKTALPEALISIDTFYASVAQAAIDAGAVMINDISGGQYDAEMLQTAAMNKVPYICMHLKGTPQTMQNETNYDNLLTEITDYFILRLEACKKAGITDVILDPGFGFAKNINQNFYLLQNLGIFKMLGRPVLAGLSRKSFIYKTLHITADEALNGTTAMQTIALLNGANILRVHDVKEAAETVKLIGMLREVSASMP